MFYGWRNGASLPYRVRTHGAYRFRGNSELEPACILFSSLSIHAFSETVNPQLASGQTPVSETCFMPTRDLWQCCETKRCRGVFRGSRTQGSSPQTVMRRLHYRLEAGPTQYDKVCINVWTMQTTTLPASSNEKLMCQSRAFLLGVSLSE